MWTCSYCGKPDVERTHICSFVFRVVTLERGQQHYEPQIYSSESDANARANILHSLGRVAEVVPQKTR